MIYLMSLFRGQMKENETQQSYSDYIGKRPKTGLKPTKCVSQQRGANRKGDSIQSSPSTT